MRCIICRAPPAAERRRGHYSWESDEGYAFARLPFNMTNRAIAMISARSEVFLDKVDCHRPFETSCDAIRSALSIGVVVPILP
jgi:hypothetical protein